MRYKMTPEELAVALQVVKAEWKKANGKISLSATAKKLYPDWEPIIIILLLHDCDALRIWSHQAIMGKFKNTLQ